MVTLRYQMVNFVKLLLMQVRKLGNCEEELPKKPVGRQSTDCRPTDGRQTADRFCLKYVSLHTTNFAVDR